ncbi:YbdK family carboxylate-amine ligase [Lentzea sp. BCCO 10_0856]|uniref:Putative glutamate--cysteine ligase 2 n=1 Tax=Lentzea miocenica TaxID=3095431 RepID=A0ABU4T7S5_9PSEU|nr:YbdK family carboxylate-amine ligase [Lentzea sp. BCCO 10_0856]MDX8034221.1 YbdK family carboxylate-amine ligase [Lentzea sp. BCCO 10_0856]
MTSVDQFGETVGVEEEFLLIDPASGRTAVRADAVLRVLENTPLTRFHAELAGTQVEAATGPCVELTELRAALSDARDRVRTAARTQGLRVVSAGLPERGAEHPVGASGGRFREILSRYAGVVADYEACACQVHVGVPDRETGVAVLNHLRPWLPTLLALSANSPHGGYASWRMVLQSRFPGSGVPPWFSSADDYDAQVSRMVECGTLVDGSMTFWLARLSRRLPTVEFRAADAVPEVEDAIVQAALSRALVRTAIRDLAAGREARRVRDDVCAAAVWTAARHGLDGPAVHVQRECRVPATDLLDELVRHVTPALEETGDLDVLEKLS